MSKRFITNLPAAFVALALVAAPAGIALAPQAAEAQSQQFTEQQLTSFVAARDEITEISGRMQQQVDQAENPEQVQKIRREANDEMVQAVRDAGLEVETYTDISRAMRQDEQLAERIDDIQASGEY